MDLLSFISESTTLICKICERQIPFKTFTQHSLDCKDLSESRQKLLESQSLLAEHISKAYDLRNQLNTNFALEKKKQEKSLFPKNDINFPKTPSSEKGSSKAKKEDMSFGSQVSEYLQQEKEEVGNPFKRRNQRAQTMQSISLQNMEDYEDEVLRSLNILKAIMQYEHLALNNVNEINLDQRNECKVRNQVNLLYMEIKDKQISEYVQGFLDLIQELIKYKQIICKKQEDLLSRSELDMMSSPSNSNKSPSSGLLRHGSFRVVSMDDDDISPKSRKRSIHESFSGRIVFANSEGDSLIKRKLTDMTPSYKSTNEGSTPKAPIGLSKFAFSAYLKERQAEDTPVSDCSGCSTLRFEETRQIKGKVPFGILKDMLRISQVRFKEEKRSVFTPRTGCALPKEETPKRRISKGSSRRKQTVDDDDELTIRRISTIACEKGRENEEMDIYQEIPEEENTKRRGSDRRGSWDLKALRINLMDLVEPQPKGKPIEEPKRRSLWGTMMMQLGESGEEDNNNEGEGEKLEEKEEGESSETSSSEDLDNDSVEEEKLISGISLYSTKGYFSDSERSQLKNLNQYIELSNIEEFDFIKLLGEGAYGKVYLVKKKTTEDLYAMKIIDYADKDSKNNKMRSLMTERDVYKLIQGDWVVKAFYTFNHQNYICFVQEYLQGGDLQGILEETGCFEESVARFYFAELVLAVESLHELGIVHRDLKPDNILVDDAGHIKLTDFGLSEVGFANRRNISPSLGSLVIKESKSEGLESFSLFAKTEFQGDTSISQSFFTAGKNSRGVSQSFPNIDSENLDKDMLNVTSIQGTEFGLKRNKKGEEVVFPFLATQEERSNWIRKKPQNNQNLLRKEKHRIVGTPDYIAPEIVKGEDCNDKAIDLWSLGVILYEFIVGVPPFHDETIDKIFTNIIQKNMQWPNIGYEEDCMTPEAADLIEKLLNCNPDERISLDEIKEHAFFKGFDWEGLTQMQAPLIPQKKEIEEKGLLDLEKIFPVDNLKYAKKWSVVKEIPTFNTKRYDLLHQLNQNLYNNHLKEAGGGNYMKGVMHKSKSFFIS